MRASCARVTSAAGVRRLQRAGSRSIGGVRVRGRHGSPPPFYRPPPHSAVCPSATFAQLFRPSVDREGPARSRAALSSTSHGSTHRRGLVADRGGSRGAGGRRTFYCFGGFGADRNFNDFNISSPDFYGKYILRVDSSFNFKYVPLIKWHY